jgi:NAD(P)-dependent dehydrogenase (short-subunit alcohol dehydrogenase family)
MSRITTPFGFHSTASEVLQGVDLSGKRAIVTGASSGIGVETARALAASGAEVTLAVRRVQAGETIADQIRQSTGNRKVLVRPLDLLDPSSIGHFTAHWEGPLHILVLNAGVMAIPTLKRTPQGWETQFATNFLGHFALAVGLHPSLASAGKARVVSVSSSANLISPVLFDDPHFQSRPYDPWVAYGQSKTANVLLAVEANRLWAKDGILANALNPGAIPTNLQKYSGGMKTPLEKRKTVEQGAATSVLLAGSPLLEGVGGKYFDDCQEAPVVAQMPADFSGGVAPYALDPDNARRLWELALNLISI